MSKIEVAVIPSAGLGTRFLPITKALPKPMLPVIDKPTIQYIIEELNDSDIKEIIIVVSPNSELIEKHFSKNELLESRLLEEGKNKLYETIKQTESYNIKFVVQPKPNGLAGAILCAKEYLKGRPFALLLGDEMIYTRSGETPCIKQLADVYAKTGKSVIATMEVFGDDISKYGNIGIKDEEDGVITVDKVVEKPSINDALSNNAIIGRYVIDYSAIEKIEKIKPTGYEICFTDALQELAKEGKLLASNFEGERFDVGDKVGYIKANVVLGLEKEETAQSVKEFIKEIAKHI